MDVFELNKSLKILDIKYRCLVDNHKEKGITSSDIYQAVLDKNVKTYNDYLNTVS